MKTFLSALIVLFAATVALAQDGGMALSPARFELEMKPGTETTVVVNLDYRGGGDTDKPARIVATLNDWTISRNGQVAYFPANTRADSASSWMIYTPGQAAVKPGSIHQIRVTIAVPPNAAPGDHLAALIVEQRPETLRPELSLRQMVVRYRMASMFYIKVAGLTRNGSFENLAAESTDEGIRVTPTLKNAGNSMVRPTASVHVLDTTGNVVADLPELEPMPVLAGAESQQTLLIPKSLAPGGYSVKYRVDFHDGSRPTEGVTELVVKRRVEDRLHTKNSETLMLRDFFLFRNDSSVSYSSSGSSEHDNHETHESSRNKI